MPLQTLASSAAFFHGVLLPSFFRNPLSSRNPFRRSTSTSASATGRVSPGTLSARNSALTAKSTHWISRTSTCFALSLPILSATSAALSASLGMCTNSAGGYPAGISAMAPYTPSAIMTATLLNLTLAASAERKYPPEDAPMPTSGRSASWGNFSVVHHLMMDSTAASSLPSTPAPARDQHSARLETARTAYPRLSASRVKRRSSGSPAQRGQPPGDGEASKKSVARMVHPGAANSAARSGIDGGGSCHSTSLPLRCATRASRRTAAAAASDAAVVVSCGVGAARGRRTAVARRRSAHAEVISTAGRMDCGIPARMACISRVI
nr:unnamed protein product [Digitaria exilis]